MCMIIKPIDVVVQDITDIKENAIFEIERNCNSSDGY